MGSSLNIVLFGETGVGKSSVVNLIAGHQIAATSSSVRGCTMSFKPHSFPFDGRILRVWDTAGLNEPQIGANSDYLDAIVHANKLIRQLADEGGVDLLLFCIRGNRITATVQSNYRLFYEMLCGSQVPLALVITHLEWEEVLEDWWDREAGNLANHGIKVAGHACVTGLPKNKKYLDARQNITRLLEKYNGDGRFNMPLEGWFIRFSRRSKSFFSVDKLGEKRIVEILTKRCNLDPIVAKELAIRLKRDTDVNPTFNVVLFGETGVGKSSIINLIAQQHIAIVASSIDSCTLESRRYDIPIDDMDFAVYDTVGLEVPEFQGGKHYLNSVQKAYELIAKLTVAGGIHLLLFCMRGGRVTETARSNYRLFSEFLCGKDTPVALVFTHLEQEERMEDYWIRERHSIERDGLRGVRHACITAIQGKTPEQQLKYMESEKKIRELLKYFAFKNRGFSPDSRSWLARLARKMRLLTTKRTKPRKGDMMKMLTQRAKLDYDMARRIVDMMME